MGAGLTTHDRSPAREVLPVSMSTYSIDIFDIWIHGSRLNPQAAANFLELKKRVAEDIKKLGLKSEFSFPDSSAACGMFDITCSERVFARVKDFAYVNPLKSVPHLP